MALLRSASEHGHEVLALNPFLSRADEVSEETDFSQFLDTKKCEHLWEVPGTWLWLRDRLKSFSPHIVHAHLFHAAVAVASTPRHKSHARLLTHHHGSIVKSSGNKLERLLDRWAGQRFDHIVGVSESVTSFLTEEYGYAPESVSTIRNGWLPPSGAPASEARGPSPTIVCVANFTAPKGHRYLLEAFVSVTERVPDARLVLVGDGDLLPQARSTAESLGVGDRIVFAGHVSDVWPYLHEAQVFALPSLYESLGIVLLEAMGAGLPVVATRVGGVQEVVQDGVTGLLVAPGDPHQLAVSLVDLLTNPTKRLRMSRAARKRAEGYRMESMLSNYMELYEELAGTT